MSPDKLTVKVPLPKLTPQQMAALFWAMDDTEQGAFFDELGTLVMSTPSTFTSEIGSMFGLDWQMYHAAQKATPLGRDAMSRISENGHNLLRPRHDVVLHWEAGMPVTPAHGCTGPGDQGRVGT